MKKLILTSLVVIAMGVSSQAFATDTYTSGLNATGNYYTLPSDAYGLLELKDTLANTRFNGTPIFSNGGTGYENLTNQQDQATIDLIANGGREFLNDAIIRSGVYTDEQVAALNSTLNNVNDNVKKLQNDIDDQKDKIAASTATAGAFAGLDNHLDEGKKFGFGVGTGYSESVAGFAVGGIIRTSTESALNAGISTTTNGGFAAKAGWNMQF
jgi:hypothetical protein